jgi:isopenicillin N synthase-like dioxygenase
MATDRLPIIDMSGLADRDPARLAEAGREIKAACATVGFFYVRNHGVPQDAIDGMLAAARGFFALPNDVKQQAKAINHRGYIGYGDALMKDAALPDLKESYVFGLERAADDAEAGKPLRGQNVWPDGAPGMQQNFTRFYDEICRCGHHLLGAIAVALGHEPGFFDDKYVRPLARTNVIHYPPHPVDSRVEQFGGAAHTDYGVVTLLLQDEAGGLQVQSPHGDWIEAAPIDGTLVVNIGDLLQRWSNDRLRSNMHRVINRSGRERYSVATFFDCDYDVTTDPRDFDLEGEPSYPPVKAGDYVLGRVREAFAYRSGPQAAAGD